MEFTDLLDEYIELRALYYAGELSESGMARFYEVKEELNKRQRGEI